MPNTRGVLIPALLGCLVIGGAAYQTWQFEQTAIDLRANEDRLVRQFSSLEMAVADLRAAQAGYVAAGQGADYWMTRFDDLTARMDAVLSERQRTGHPDAAAHLSTAQDRLEALRTSDSRARRYVGNDQRLLASDVIFHESLEVLGRLTADVATAREVEIARSREEAARLREYQAALAGGALFLLLGLILVAGRRTAPKDASAEAEAGTLNLQAPDPSLAQTSPGPPEETAARTNTPAADRAAHRAALDDTAAVCVDLARLLDGRDLPSLLGRSAAAIGAKGLVLWTLDEQGEMLTPSLSHGYSDRMLQRLGTLPLAADNVTSVAGRTLQAQVVPATSPDGAGALAVPLIGPSGCVGVLAAEVRGHARDGSTLPHARMIAAQLAAVIAPSPAEQTARPQAAEGL